MAVSACESDASAAPVADETRWWRRIAVGSFRNLGQTEILDRGDESVEACGVAIALADQVEHTEAREDPCHGQADADQLDRVARVAGGHDDLLEGQRCAGVDRRDIRQIEDQNIVFVIATHPAVQSGGGAEAHLAEKLRRLSPQERRVLSLIADGLTNRQIADELNLAEKTVKNYVSNLLAKLGMSRRTEAAALAARLEERHKHD